MELVNGVMRVDSYTFRPDDGPAFEFWAPREMRQVDAPECLGALVAQTADGFAPNLVVGHNRVTSDTTLDALASRLDADAAALPGAEPEPDRTVDGTAGEVRIVAFTHAGGGGSGRLYQMTACLLAPPAEDDPDSGERNLIFLTGTCTVDQAETWDPAFVDAASSVRFG